MAQVVYMPFPSVEPRATPPSDLQNIPTNPREFGAQVGQGMEQLGAGATKAGKFYGEVAADDATNKWQEEANNLLYGDPNTPGDRGLYGRVGEDGMKAIPGVRTKIGALRDQYRQGLMTPESQLQFDQYTRRFQNILSGEIGRYYETQFTAYTTATNKASGDLALHGISAHATDPDAVNNFTGNLMQAYIREAQNRHGENPHPDIINDAMARARSDSITQQVRALARTDPAHASEVLKNNSDALSGPGLDQLTRELKGPMDDAVANSALQRARGGGAGQGGPPLPTEQAATLVSQHESSGDYNIGYGGADLSHAPLDATGFPQWAGAEGPQGRSHAAGKYQFEPGEWHRYAGPLGIKDFSPGSQDRVFKAAYENEGFAPWAPYNANLRAALGGSVRVAANAPAGPHAPGVSDIAEAQSNLAVNFGRTIATLNADPALDANADAKAKAIQKAELDYRSHEMILTGQSKALTEGRNIAADGYVQRMMKGPIDAGIINDIANDHSLDSATRENLWRLYDAHAKTAGGGDTAKYGPQFYQYYQRIHADDNDPNKIRDPSQVYPLAVPKDDGSQDLTLAGVEKLTSELKAQTPAKVGQQKIQAGALAYAKHKLSFEADYGFYKIRDPSGEDAFNIGFTPAFFDYWEKGLAAGKTPQELVAKDQLDKLVAPFKRSDATEMRDRIEADADSGTAAAKKSGPPEAPPAAVEFLRTHPNLRGAFDQKYGAGMADKLIGQTAPLAPPLQ